MGRLLKAIVLAAFVVVAGYFLGSVGGQIGSQSALMLSAPMELLPLGLWFLVALVVLLLTAGIAAALIRPMWACLLAFAFSSAAMLAALGFDVGNGLLCLIYFVASALYAWGVSRGLGERIRFSVQPISEGQSLLVLALVLVACGALYLGLATKFERECFTIPPYVVDMVAEGVEERIGEQMPPAEKAVFLGELKVELQKTMQEEMDKSLASLEKLVPFGIGGARLIAAVVAFGIFFPLYTIGGLVGGLAGLCLRLVFPLLGLLGVTRTVVEVREVTSLTIA